MYLNISVENFHVVKLFKSPHELDEDIPNGGFRKLRALLNVLCDLYTQITVARKFHHDAVCLRPIGTRAICWLRQ